MYTIIVLPTAPDPSTLQDIANKIFPWTYVGPAGRQCILREVNGELQLERVPNQFAPPPKRYTDHCKNQSQSYDYCTKRSTSSFGADDDLKIEELPPKIRTFEEHLRCSAFSPTDFNV